MFWGLIMEPQRRYSQTVKRAFHISMAALDETTSDDSPTQVICSFDDRNYLLCTLEKGKTSQVALDLNYEVGDKISFATNGKSHVHLTGYLMEEQFPLEDGEEEEENEVKFVKNEMPTMKKRQKKDSSSSSPKKKFKTLELLEAVNSNDEDDSDDSDVNTTDLVEDEDEMDTTFAEEAEGEEDEDDDGDEEEDEDNEEEEESDDDDEDVEGEESDEEEVSSMSEDEVPEPKKAIENGVASKKEKKQKLTQSPDNTQKEKQQHQQQKSEKQKKDKSTKGDKTPVKGDKTPAKGEKTLGKGEKTPAKGDKTPAKSPKQSQEGGTPQKRTIEGGVIVEDVRIGNGPVAKPGKFVRVFYEGKFKHNNKIFDSTTKGAGFEFRLGRQEVIKGWDVGVSGMKVGGKRRITCPPNMAYGQKGSPPTIPPNSTLVFDVELRNVK